MGVVLGVIHYPIIPLSHYFIISLHYYPIILLSYYSISLSILYLSYLSYVSRQSTPNGFPAAFAARIASSIQIVDYGDAEFGFAR